MKKTLFSILALVYAVMLVSVAKAEISISGYQEFYMGSGDQSKILGNDASTYGDTSFSGLSNGRFTRITFVGKTVYMMFSFMGVCLLADACKSCRAFVWHAFLF